MRERKREEEGEVKLVCGDDDNKDRSEKTQPSPAQHNTASKPRLKLPTANTQWQEGTLLFSPQSTNMAVSPRNRSHHDWKDRGQA